MKNRVNKIRTELHLWRNRLHFLAHVEKTPRFFRFVISEKYKKIVTYSKFFLTGVGLISSLFVFPLVIYSFLFALALFIIQTIIERTIFSYVTLYVQPLPNFTIEPKKWLGMSFGYAVDNGRTVEIPSVGMLFDDESYAKKIYDLILSWNYNEHDDRDNNINMSVILQGRDRYVFFAYPSKDRKTVNDFFNSAKSEREKKSLTDVHYELLMQIVLGKGCKITQSSYLPIFIKRYKAGVPFYFDTFVYRDGRPQKVAGLRPIVVHNLKIKRIEDLTRKDIEYEILKLKNWDEKE